MEITSEELKSKIEGGEKVIVDFWATWCGPCKAYKPTFEKVAKTSEVQMYTMDVESNMDLAKHLGISKVPTTKAFNNGEEVFTESGMLSANQLNSVISNLING